MLDINSQNYLVNLAAGRFTDKLTSELQSKARYDLNTLLDKAKTAASKGFPIPWGSVSSAAHWIYGIVGDPNVNARWDSGKLHDKHKVHNGGSVYPQINRRSDKPPVSHRCSVVCPTSMT